MEGANASTAITVRNTLDRPIYNVTLALQNLGRPLELFLEETFAGDPPQGSYAFWRQIPAGGNGLVFVRLRAETAEGQEIRINNLVLFDDGVGGHYVSETEIVGEVLRGSSFKATSTKDAWPPLVLLLGMVLLPLAARDFRRRD